MSRLKLANRRQLVTGLLSKTPDTADYWEYAVSTSWVDSWYKKDGSMTSYPEKASNQLTMSSNEKENTYVPETIFRMLVSWFGVDPKHLLRRRPIYCGYRNLEPISNPYGGCHVIADRELDHVPIWVGDLNEIMIDKHKNVFEVFAWDSFDHIGKQVIRSLNLQLRSESMVRFWFGIKTVYAAPTLEPIFEMRQQFLSKLIEHVPEVQSLMEKRSCQRNPKYWPKSSDSDQIAVRLPLGEALLEVFKEQVPQICIGVEEVGVEEIKDKLEIEDIDNDGIVALSSIRNEWDDCLTTALYEHTKAISKSSDDLNRQLMSTARQIVGDKLNEIDEIKADYVKRFEDLQEREKAVRVKENENNEKEVELQNRLAAYKKGMDDFQRQKKKQMDDMKMIEDQNKISDSIVSLNIGGIVYTTSVDTLTQEDNSLFAVMFSGKHPLKRQPDGTYFVDRDGMNFRYILNYLRDGEDAIHTIPEEERILREVLREAKYYRLHRLETMLQNKVGKLVGQYDTRSMASI